MLLTLKTQPSFGAFVSKSSRKRKKRTGRLDQGMSCGKKRNLSGNEILRLTAVKKKKKK